MTQSHASAISAGYRLPNSSLLLFGVLFATGALLSFGFGTAIVYMIGVWNSAEFSHGYLIPFIAAFLVWQRVPALRAASFKGSWAGFLLLVAALGLDVIGRLSALFVLQHLALILAIAGLVLAMGGCQVLYILRMPLGILLFMVPLPNIFLNPMSSQLQLISSSIGVAIMRLFGVVVLQEGNVIDLGSYRLEVAEACSGLRYLFPLMTLGFLTACFYRAELWKRVTIFLSSIPITILMNSLRIASIGLMVDRWGTGMAEGAIHEVQGWMMFMLSTAVLLLEVGLLSRIGGNRQPWKSAFDLGTELPKPTRNPGAERRAVLNAPAWAAEALLAIFAVLAVGLPGGRAVVPARASLDAFPLQVAQWTGRRETMDQIYLDALKLDDYLLADYTGVNGGEVNFYVAWYNTQSAGEATHSPRACLPGGGWQILDSRRAQLPGISLGGAPLAVNRVLMQQGDQRDLVYYWFMQRGRIVTSEYMVKWYLMVDALTKHRTDGALVRLIVPLSSESSPDAGDHQLQAFVRAISPRLDSFIPG